MLGMQSVADVLWIASTELLLFTSEYGANGRRDKPPPPSVLHVTVKMSQKEQTEGHRHRVNPLLLPRKGLIKASTMVAYRVGQWAAVCCSDN